MTAEGGGATEGMRPPEPRWTPAQRAAVTWTGGDLLVSAAAGSGKTAVLVERVLRRLLDRREPAEADRLLVVTFTEAAAAEMRARIAAGLLRAAEAQPADELPRRQLALLGRAPISTLHAFCLQLLRQHFHRLRLDPRFRVLSEHEAALLEQDVLEDLLQERFAGAEPDFLALADRYGGRAERDLTDVAIALRHTACSRPAPEAWLAGLGGRFRLAADAAVDATPWAGPVRAAALRELREADAALAHAARLADLPGGPAALAATLAKDRARLAALAASVPDLGWDEVGVALAAADTWAALRGGGDADPALAGRVRKLRDRAKAGLRGLLPVFRPGAELLGELRALAPAAHALAALVADLDRAFTAAKGERGAIDFSDMERLALRLLSAPGSDPAAPAPGPVAVLLRQRLQEVLVDEYQDINEIQDAVLRLLARGDGQAPGNRFLVGDVKQSIYRFRQAEPELFLRKMAALPRLLPERGERRVPPGGGRLDLSANFRSRAGILAAVNFVFRQVMGPATGGPVYDAAAELQPGAEYPALPGGLPDPRVEVHILPREGSPTEAGVDPDPAGPADEVPAEEGTALAREANAVARRIDDLVRRGAPIWDAARAAYRPLRFGDVAILLRAARNQGPVFAQALADAGVPVLARGGGGYLGALEVETVLALLRVIDNPLQDIPLAAVLRSPLVGLSAEDLARIRLCLPAATGADFFSALAAAAAGSVPPAAAHLGPDAGLRQRLAGFLGDLERWRTAARRGPLARLIHGIYAETDLLAYVSGLPGGAQRRGNLLALADRAAEFDGFARQGLFRFLRFIDRLRERQEDLAPAPVGNEQQDVVRLLTIHQSKGLEYPVVVVADLGGGFRADGGGILVDRHLGLGPRVVDDALRVAYPSLAFRAVREQARAADLAEEMRLLYVAMTRARERLLLFGSVADLPARLERWLAALPARGWPLDPAVLAGARCLLDLLGPALLRSADAGPLRALLPDGAPGLDGGEQAADPARWSIQVAGGGADGGTTSRPAGEVAAPVSPAPGHREADAAIPADPLSAAGPAAAPPTSPPPAGSVPPSVQGDAALAVAGPECPADPVGEHAAPPAAAAEPGAPAPAAGAAPPVGPSAPEGPAQPAPPVAVPNGSPLPDLARRLRWRYAFRELADRPAKRTVSELRARADPLAAEAPAPADLLAESGTLPRPRLLAPAGDGGAAALRGTAVHRVLQHLDLKRPLDAADLRAQVAEMRQRERLSAEEAAAVDPAAILRLLAHPLGRRLRAAPRVLREWMFVLGVPAARLDPDLGSAAAGEVVAVQGVVDCLFEADDGGFVLIDFKTDRLAGRPDGYLLDRYGPQVALYRQAVRTLLGRPVRESYLYALAEDLALVVPE